MQPWVSRFTLIRTKYGLSLLVLAIASLRLTHIHLLWTDEDYHLAAAIQILHGKLPYRDFWYDKPPLAAFYYLLIAGRDGWPLRVLDVAYIIACCTLAYRLALFWWAEQEARLAALLLVFFTTFYFHYAIIPLAPDALMMLPHMAAIYFAKSRRAFYAGLFAGFGFLANVKAVFALAACVPWVWPELLPLLAGFVGPLALGLAAALASGSWTGYYDQVWRWGLLYAKGAPSSTPLRTGIVRTLDWLGFHSALALAAVSFFRQEERERFRLALWLLLSLASVTLGGQFATRYYLQVLPPLVIIGARGLTIAMNRYGRRAWIVIGLLLAVPLVRFGPRYATLIADNLANHEPAWSDVSLDLDSRHAAAKVQGLAKPGDTLFVWGYRPDIYVYTRLISDNRFWDSQPLTGVPADRHLAASLPVDSAAAAEHRRELAGSRPEFIVDGLGLLNPRLSPQVYPELRDWLARYKLVGKTWGCLIYKRLDGYK